MWISALPSTTRRIPVVALTMTTIETFSRPEAPLPRAIQHFPKNLFSLATTSVVTVDRKRKKAGGQKPTSPGPNWYLD